jgi:hypothetical protein
MALFEQQWIKVQEKTFTKWLVPPKLLASFPNISKGSIAS